MGLPSGKQVRLDSCSFHGGSEDGGVARVDSCCLGSESLDIGGLLAAGVPSPCLRAIKAEVCLCV